MVIVGAGECGARAAFALREQGYDGPVTLIGEEPHLPYERPPLSKAAMTSEDHPSPVTVTDHQRLADNNISLISSARAVGIDRDNRSVLLEDGRTIPYERLLLATGSTPRKLPMPGLRTSLRLPAQLRRRARHPLASKAGHARCHHRRRLYWPRTRRLCAQARRHGHGHRGAATHSDARRTGGDRQPSFTPSTRRRASTCARGVGLASIEDDGTVVHAHLRGWHAPSTPMSPSSASAPSPSPRWRRLQGSRSTTASRSMRRCAPAIRISSRPATAARSRSASMAAGASRLEAWRNAQDQGALAARNLLGAVEGHVGRAVVLVGSIRPYAADRRTCRMRRRLPYAATSATARSSCSIWRRTAAWSRQAGSAPATRSRATSALPK